MSFAALEQVAHLEAPPADDSLGLAAGLAVDESAVIGAFGDAHARVPVAAALAVVGKRTANESTGASLVAVLCSL